MKIVSTSARAIRVALFLSLSCVHAHGAWASAAPVRYRYVSTADGKSFERTLHACDMAQPFVHSDDEPLSVEWTTLSKGIFWPFSFSSQRPDVDAMDAEFSVFDADKAAVHAFAGAVRKSGVASHDAECSEWSLRIHGALRDSNDGGAASGEVRLEGAGRALICRAEPIPRAATVRIERRISPSLWDLAPGRGDSISTIDSAWAELP